MGSHPTDEPCSQSNRYQAALDAAIGAAREAGELLRTEFHRPGGPRGSGGHADVDEQAEQVIREKILAAFPAAYRGEETGTASGSDKEHIWLVDPNDGTSAYLKGWRGSAISIALVRQGALVLGVVYAPTYPDDNGDLFAWAEGCGPSMRNGKAVTINLADKDLKGADDVPAIVFISQDADKTPRPTPLAWLRQGSSRCQVSRTALPWSRPGKAWRRSRSTAREIGITLAGTPCSAEPAEY